MDQHKQPISLEDLLARRRQQQQESERPRFLTREERARLAREREEELKRAQPRQPGQNAPKQTSLPAKRRQTDMHADNAATKDHESTITDGEKALLREKFLGIRAQERRKLRRFTDKKFNFEWDAADDTSSLAPALPVVLRTGSGDLQSRRFDDRHWSEKGLHEMTDRDWRIFKEDFNINTSGGVLPHPIRHWSESRLPPELLTTIRHLNYTQPTPIQRQAIPLALDGRDFIGVAETGSGKTASFILPMITEIMKLPKMNADIAADGPYGLVLVPTRELANQIQGEARKFLAPLGFNCFAIVGGHAIAEQSFQLRNGAEIIIATPGRLRDCLDQHVIVLNQLKYAVLDEADRMIDLNFEEDLRYILNCIPQIVNGRTASSTATGPNATKYPIHLTMFSATMPAAVERLARTYLQRPASISIGQAGSVADTIEQRVEMVREEDKSQRLVEILQADNFDSHAPKPFPPPIIIFVNQKRTVDYLCKRLDSFGFKTVSLHGGKSQDQREASINLLKTGQRDMLVATDVAGRGIDIKNVSLVVNYDMAKSIEDYTHRVGRTGRAGAKGTAISFLTADDAEIYHDLRVLLQKSPKSHLPPEFLQHESTRQRK